MNNTQPTQSAINKPDTASQKPIVPDSISMNTSGNLNRNTSDSFNMNTSNDTNIDSYYGNTNGSTNTTSTDNTNNSSSDFSFSLKGYEPTDNKNI